MKKLNSKKILIAAAMIALFSTQLFSQSRKLGLAKENANTNTNTQVPRIELSKNQICNVYALDYSSDEKHLVAGYNNGSVRIWDITTGKMERELKGHTGVVWSVAYSPDGKTIVSGSADKTIKCWDAQTGKLIRTLPSRKGDKGHTGIVSYVTFNHDGTYIASGSSDKSVRFWEASTGNLLQPLENTHTETIASISYSHSGRFVATASWDKTEKIYYTMGGSERNILTGHTGAIYAVQFSPDEKYVATGSADRTVRIYEVETGKFVRSISGISGEVWSLCYSPDSKIIATGNSDGSVILFDAETGKRLSPLNGHEKEVRSCVFDKTGSYLYSGDSEGVIKMWDVKKGTLVVTMLQVIDGNWVTWTPDGFLTGSEGALAELSYSVGDKKYSLDEIKSIVDRPNIVAAKMQNKSVTEISENDTFASIIARDSAPVINFAILNTDGSARTDNTQRDFIVAIDIKDTGSGIGNVYVKLNGRAFVASEKGSQTPLSLRPGKNTVSVSVFDSTNKKEHQSSQVEIEWKGNIQKSRLFVLSAGVDKYSDKSVPELSGCVSDATAFAEISRLYAGDLYLNVFETVLIDKQVTRKNLIDSIQKMGQSIQPDDVFILYLAGHGITHTDGEYYFIPSDFKNSGADPIPKSGVSKWELVSALSSISAENITVILDTCNSASFGSQQISEEDLLQLSKYAIIERFGAMSGFDLISSCTSTQVALDNFKGHGMFTYCLLEGIQGAADLDQNGQITSAELATYVIKEVPVQSYNNFGYKQEPQRSQPKFDFPMFGKLNPLEGQSIKEALEIAKLVKEKGLDLEAASEQVTVTTTTVSTNQNNKTKNKSKGKTNYTIEDFATKRVKWNEVPFSDIEALSVYENKQMKGQVNWTKVWNDAIDQWTDKSENNFFTVINSFDTTTLNENTIGGWIELIRIYYEYYPEKVIASDAGAPKYNYSTTATTTSKTTNYDSDYSIYFDDGIYYFFGVNCFAGSGDKGWGTEYGIWGRETNVFPYGIGVDAIIQLKGYVIDSKEHKWEWDTGYANFEISVGVNYFYNEHIIPYINGGIGYYGGTSTGLSIRSNLGVDFVWNEYKLSVGYSFSNMTSNNILNGLTITFGSTFEGLFDMCCGWW